MARLLLLLLSLACLASLALAAPVDRCRELVDLPWLPTSRLPAEDTPRRSLAMFLRCCVSDLAACKCPFAGITRWPALRAPFEARLAEWCAALRAEHCLADARLGPRQHE
eukprot:EG_transcript_55756